ncbi:MAG: DNA-directed RNA polymerase subunit beta', partial [Alphaproteobacteria bacterium]
SIYMMSHSGARGSPAQMKQLAGMRGLMAKPSGEIIETPIISNFKEGLTVLEYFNSTHGARKGLADTALKTANSGYLTRRLVDVAQDCIVTVEDCGTEEGIHVTAVVDGGELVETLAERILGRTAQEDVIHPQSNEVLVGRGEQISEVAAEEIDEAGVQSVFIRSPLTCEQRWGICATCYGRDLARGTHVNVGEAVGVIAAQSIGEPGTQLTMRTFHIGGTAQVADQSFVESSQEGEVKIVNRNVVANSLGANIVMARNCQIQILGPDGRERASHKVSYGTRLMVDDGEQVKRGQRLAEWDPYTVPILTEIEGTVKYEDLVDGVSIREVADEATGISQKMVIDWRAAPKGSELRPAIALVDQKGEVLKLPNGTDARYLLSVDAILSVDDNAKVQAGDVLARIPTEGAKTRDITGGLPRVAELFEARRPKDHAIIAEVSGRVEFGRDYKNKRRIVIRPTDESLEPVEYLVPKGKHIAVQEGDFIERGEFLLDGNPAPHDILRINGVEQLAGYLVAEIQDVYRLQGVKINDKHIEVIVRQMLQKVEIEEPGESTWLAGEQVDRIEFEETNDRLRQEDRAEAKGSPVLLGITKASLQTRSFISAASFQETTRVLTEAAVNGKVDMLEGLKENVIVGRLIPAGTGGSLNRFKRIAADRDRELLKSRETAPGLPSAEGEEGPESEEEKKKKEETTAA